MKKAAIAGSLGDCINPTVGPSVSYCLALLRQGNLEDWRPHSYERIADYFEHIDPIASLMWADLAQRCR